MPGPNSQVSILDGTLDFSGGVNSIKVATVQSERNIGGLARNELAWMVNGQVRDGGLRPRFGWTNLGSAMDLDLGRFQGAFLYKHFDTDPYFILSIAGRIYQMFPDVPDSFVDLSAVFGLTNPATPTQVWFCQAEQFLVIQAGDNTTLPLFWDGVTLRRSSGIQPQGQLPEDSPVQSVTIRNDTAAPGVKVPANAMSSIVGTPLPTGATATGRFGPTDAVFTVPAIGATVTVELKSPYTGPVPAKAGISRTNYATRTGEWTIIDATTFTPAGETALQSELPAAGPMDYFMGRIWYAQGTQIAAGDIVRGVAGSATYNYNDSVLKVTENPLAIGGDGFAVPSDDGNIRAVKHSANIDAALGQGRLYIFTRKAVYALQVPVTREDWINTSAANGPLMTVVQLVNGSVNDRSVVPVNGDLFYHSLEPGIRSLAAAVRTFSQWGNIEISANINRLIRNEDRSLLYAASGIFFNNRLLQACLPTDTDHGVVWQAIAPLDFIPISGFNQASAPVWEGMYQGLNIMQLAAADFGGLERAFAITASDLDGKFQVWELSQSSRRDNLDSRITWQFETPAFTWGDEATLKRLVGGEVWFDQLSGTADFTLEYRPDSDSCWHLWHIWQRCNIANTCEDIEVLMCYPSEDYPDAYQAMETLPQPRPVCANANATRRPTTIGYQFQFRLTVKGWCRIRGLWFHASPFERSLYSRLSC